jgi:hypothetical protein
MPPCPLCIRNPSDERNATRTKLAGTFMIVVVIRVISFAIFAFVSSNKNPSSVMEVNNGIRFTPKGRLLD